MFFGMAVGPALGGIVGTMGNHSRPLLIFYIALVRLNSLIPVLLQVTNELPGDAACRDTIFDCFSARKSWSPKREVRWLEVGPTTILRHRPQDILGRASKSCQSPAASPRVDALFCRGYQ